MKTICRLIWNTAEFLRIPLGPLGPWILGGMISWSSSRILGEFWDGLHSQRDAQWQS